MTRSESKADVTALLERAVSDLQQGWHEAALDALGRAIRVSEASRWQAVEQRQTALEERQARVLAELAKVVDDLDARVQAVEKRRINPALAAQNELSRSHTRRLREAVKAVLDTSIGRPTAFQVCRTLEHAGFTPLPSVRTVRKHLAEIRGKRHGTAVSQTATLPPADPSILQP